MDRVSPAFKRRRFQLGIAALCLGLAFLAGTCDNPVDLLGEMEVKAMKANDRYLVVRSINIPLEGGSFSPTGTIEIYFDRDIDPDTISSDTIVIMKETEIPAKVEYPSQGVSYIQSSRCVRIRVYPYLDSDNDYSLNVIGVRGLDGSSIYDQSSKTFRTKGVTVGVIAQLIGTNSDSQKGYSISNTISAKIQINDYHTQYKYSVEYARGGEAAQIWVPEAESWTNWASPGEITLPNLSGLSDGEYTILLKVKGRTGGASSGEDGIPDEAIIIVDTIAPNQPVGISGPASPTLSARPTWSWSSGGNGGAGVFQARLNDGIWSGIITAYTYTSSSLADGLYILGVRERDLAGNWSGEAAGSELRVTSLLPYNTQINVSTTPLLEWRSVGIGRTYYIDFKKSDNTWQQIAETTNTTFQIRLAGALNQNTLYTWRVRSSFKGFITYLPSEHGSSFTTGTK